MKVRYGVMSTTLFPPYFIYFSGQSSQETSQNQQNQPKKKNKQKQKQKNLPQDPAIVIILILLIIDYKYIHDLEKIILPLWTSSVNYGCRLNCFLKMVLAVN